MKAAIVGGIFAIVAAFIPLWWPEIHWPHWKPKGNSFYFVQSFTLDAQQKSDFTDFIAAQAPKISQNNPEGFWLIATYEGTNFTAIHCRNNGADIGRDARLSVDERLNKIYFESTLVISNSPSDVVAHHLIVNNVFTNQIKIIRFNRPTAQTNAYVYFETLNDDIHAPCFIIGWARTALQVNDDIIGCN